MEERGEVMSAGQVRSVPGSGGPGQPVDHCGLWRGQGTGGQVHLPPDVGEEDWRSAGGEGGGGGGLGQVMW